MAENESSAAVEEQTQDFEYPIKVEDAGPATKRVSIEIPQDRIAEKLAEQFKELRQQAAIPGFRPGHAPQKLIEKRFSGDVKDQVRRSLISESYAQAVEKNNLQVIGEPRFDNAEQIALPDSGSLTYSFEVEVQPEINLPELKGLNIKRPKIEITEENVEQAMTNLREQQGALLPVEGRAVEANDYLTADVHVRLDGNVVAHQHEAQVVARPGRVAGIQVDDLGDKLVGANVSETRNISAKVPASHPNEAMRNKDVQIEITVRDIKKLEAAEINDEFLESLGFENKQELLDALREQMEERINYDVQQAMREQVNRYLLENVHIDLPTTLSDRQELRVVQRRAMDLMTRGIPRDQIEANLDRLRGGARDEAVRELRLFFILQKIANEQNVDVDEAELNGRIAMLAAQRGARPEKVKQEMSKDGTLQNLYIQMREQKAIDKIIADANLEDIDVNTLREQQEKLDTEQRARDDKSDSERAAKSEEKSEEKAEAKSEEKPEAKAEEATEEPAEKKPKKPRKKKSEEKSE